MVAMIEGSGKSPLLIVSLDGLKDVLYAGTKDKSILPRDYIQLRNRIDDALTYIPVIDRIGYWSIAFTDLSDDRFVLLALCEPKDQLIKLADGPSLAYLYTLSSVRLAKAKIPETVDHIVFSSSNEEPDELEESA